MKTAKSRKTSRRTTKPAANEGAGKRYSEVTDPLKAEKTLWMSEEQYRKTVEEAPIPIIMQAEDGEVLHISRTWTELTGYTIDDVRSFDEWTTHAVYGEGADEVRDYLRNLFGHSSHRGRVEFVIRTQSGELRHWSFSTSAPGQLTDGRRFIIGMALDVTERRRAEEALRLRTAELETVNKEVEAFSYTISHGLKGPLRSIEGFTRALTEDYAEKLDDTARNYLRRVNDASVRMSELIEAILTLSRQTRGELKETSVNLSELARMTADELKRKEPRRKVNFIIAEGIKVKGDRMMLGLVMQNLFQNAWKFTSKHESARIEFGRCELPDANCTVKSKIQNPKSEIFYVRDNGAGFEMEYADKLFMPFMRLHSESEFPGLGVGLSTVNHIISRHGGRIWAEGEPEKGATFYFSLG